MVPAILGVLGLIVAIRLIAGSYDGDRIERYLRGRRCRLLSRRWAPFARGWLGESSERHYAIRYRDAGGAVHAAVAKTSMGTGVYLTDDEITEWPADAPQTMAELRLENQRLRREIEQLRRRG